MNRTRFCCAIFLIAGCSAAPVYAAFTGVYQIAPSGGAFLNGKSDVLPAGAPSLEVDFPLTAKGADGFHTIAVDGRASIYVDTTDYRHFGLFAGASAVANPSGWTLQPFSIKSITSLLMNDSLRLVGGLSSTHYIRMQAFWTVNGELSGLPQGTYSSQIPAVSPDYVNANSDSVLEISGSGVGLGPYGGLLLKT